MPPLNHNRTRRNRLCLFSLALTLGVAGLTLSIGPLAAAPDKRTAPPKSADVGKRASTQTPLTEDAKIAHILNRLGFGARPGDAQKVKAIGFARYIDLQLHPDRIDDSSVDRQLAAYAQLQLSGEQLADEYNTFTAAARKMKGVTKAAKKQTARENAAMQTDAAGQANKSAASEAGGAQTEIAIQPASTTSAPVGKPGKGTKKALKKPGAQAGANGEAGMDALPVQDMRALRQEAAQTALPVSQAHEQFMAAKMLRAIESERQLQEVLADFWNNHFNIDLRRAPCGILKIADDRDAIRPHILGKFRDLLGASAHSPAMLVYLDNYLSTADADAQTAAPMPRRRKLMPAAKPAKKKGVRGLNENYAREIMELHTLGVDGGYTQNDVREVARCFTGWSIAASGRRQPGQGKYGAAGAFRFNPAMHDNGAKTVLGQTIPAGGGSADGEKVLDILASHPATMRHVSYQLCQRLVSDTPPPSLVDKCVATWKRTDGDLREITRVIITSPEFYAPSAYRSKIKSPFEYAVSAVRALGASYADVASPAGGNRRARGKGQARIAAQLIKPPKGGGYLDTNANTLLGQIATMGQPLFQYQAPTGYPEDSSKWVSAGALISRLNFALALTGSKLSDVSDFHLPLASANSAPQTAALKDAAPLVDRLAEQILQQPLSASTRATLLKQMQDPTTPAANTPGDNNALTNRIAALLLGSPEFQRR